MEPFRKDHIRQLEERLLQPEVRKSAEEITRMLAPEFVEFTSSGRILNRSQTIEALQLEDPFRRSIEDFEAVLLAPSVALATYRAVRYAADGRLTVRSLRSSVWKFIDDRWQMVFHQGTVLKNEP